MKVTSVDKNLQQILISGYYKIPRFQRPYSWDRENIEDFWNDTITDNEGDYFIGSMVVYKLNGNKLGLVDGQQRMTTVTMLLSVIREYFKKHGFDELARGTQNLIEKSDLDNQKHYVLQTETSYPYLQEYIQKFDEPEVEPSLKEEEKNLEKGFNLLRNKVGMALDAITSDSTIPDDDKKELIKRKLIEIRDKLLSLKLIFVELDNEDDAYIIFETLNTRGKDLRVSDLVKNHLTKLIKKKNKNVDLTKDKWQNSREIIEGSQAGINMDSFLLHYWLSKYEYTTQKKLFKLIKKTIKKPRAKAFLDDILESAKTYRGFQETSYRNWDKQELNLKYSLDAIQLFKVRQAIPMLLAVMSEYENRNIKLKHAKEIIKSIEYFHFIFTAVTSQRSSGGISFMYAHHARNLRSADNTNDKVQELNNLKVKLREKLPNKDEFLANFFEIEYSKTFTKQRKLVHYILRKFDEYNQTKGKTGNVIDYNSMTIEHVLPQNPSNASGNDDYHGLIGNLILVSGSLNSETLSNKPFSEKKRIFKDSKLVLDDVISNASKWEEEEIKERTRKIGSLCYEDIFKF